MIKLVIADDHSMLREGFKTLLRKETDIEVVAEAGDGQELLQIVSTHLPDVVITDIQMPVMDGIEAMKKMKASYPAIGVIALSMYTENTMVINMLKAGAKGYLTKNTTRDELMEAIKSVYEGGSYFCDETSLALARLIDTSQLNPYQHETPVELTAKERDIIRFICKEYSTKQIAPMVKLTKRTVDSYRKNIQEKIGAKNVVGFVMYAIRNGLYSLE